MADSPTGGDEITRLILEIQSIGIDKNITKLQELKRLLLEINKTIAGGAQTTPNQMKVLNQELNKIGQAATQAGKATKQSFDDIKNSTTELNQALKMTAGMTGKAVGKDEKKNLREYQKELSALGQGLIAKPPTFELMAKNIRTIGDALRSGTNAGYANKKSLDAISSGKPAGMEHAKSFDILRIQAGVARKGLEGITSAMMNNAKQAQWTGRQMIEGISLPIAGIGISALRTFDSINKEMVQLKKVTEYKEDYKVLEDQMKKVAIAYGMSLKSTATLFTDIAALGKSGNQINAWADAIGQISMIGDIDPKSAMDFFRVINSIYANGSVKGTTDLMAQLNAVADETSVQLKDLAVGFPQVGPVMQQMGFSAAGTASSLAGMYRRGIDVNEGAHALKFSLQRLVAPTKNAKTIIDELGFSFINTNGHVGDAEFKMMALADQFKNMSDAEKLASAPELFGGRQSAKMISYFKDIALGNEEIKKLSDGIIKVDQVQSDFLRGMIASGEIKIPGVQSAQSRYDKALKEIQKDPSTAMKRIKTQFQIVSYEIGKAIAPAFISISEQIVKVLNLFTNAPPAFQKMVIGFAAIVAAIGPVKYIFAQMEYTVASFTKTFSKLLPKLDEIKGGWKEAQKILQANPNAKILEVGDKVVYAPGRTRFDKLKQKVGLGPKVPEGAKQVTLDSIKADTEQMIANDALIASNDALVLSEERIAVAEGLTAEAMKKRTIETFKADVAQSKLNRGQKLAKDNTDKATASIQDAMNSVIPFSKGKQGPSLVSEVSIASADKAAKSMTELEKGMAEVSGTARTAAKSAAAVGAETVGTSTKAAVALGTQAIAAEGLTVAETEAAVAAEELGVATGVASGGLTIVAFVAIAAAIGAVVLAIKMFKDNWKSIKTQVQPSLDKLKSAFDNIKAAFKRVGDAIKQLVGVFSTVFNTMDKNANGSKATADQVGNTLSKIIDFVAELVNYISIGIAFAVEVIKQLRPVIEGIAYYFRDLVIFVSSLINGDWKTALKAFGGAIYEEIRPIAMFVQQVIQFFYQLDSSILSILSNIGTSVYNFVNSILASIPLIGQSLKSLASNITGSNAIGNALKSQSKSISEAGKSLDFVGFLDNTFRSGLDGALNSTISDATGATKGSAEDLGGNIGDNITTGVGDAVSGSGGVADWLKDWLSQVKSELDSQLGKIKQSAIDAFDKASEAALKVYDDRIKAMDEQEKAEEKLFKTQEYFDKRREMLAKREIDRLNYTNNRAKAIYEGRTNDVRVLDLEEQKSKADSGKEIANLDQTRATDLLKEQKNLQKEEINSEKEAAKTRLDIQKTTLTDAIDLITKYAPQTVEEYNTMLGQINALLKQNGIDVWPEMAKSGMDRFQEAFTNASTNIRKDFFWSGDDAAAEWMRGFAPEDVVAILKNKLNSGGGGAGTAADQNPIPSIPDQSGLNLPTINFGAMFSGLGDFFKEWWPNILAFMVGPVTGIISVIGKVLYGIITGIDWGGVGSAIWDGIKTAFGAVGGFFGSMFDGASGGIKTALDPIIGTIQDILDPIIGTIQDVLGPVLETLGSIFSTVWKGISTAVKFVWNSVLKPIFNHMFDFFNNQIRPVLQFFYTLFQFAFNIVSFAVGKMWDFVSPIFTSVKDCIMNSLIPSLSNLGGIAESVWGGIQTAIGAAWDFIKPIWDSMWRFVENNIVPIFKTLWDWSVTVWNGIKDAITTAWGFIKPIWDAVYGFIQDSLIPAFQRIWDKVSETWTWITDKISAAWDTVYNAIKNGWNTFAGALETGINGLIKGWNTGIDAWNKIPFHDHVDHVENINIARLAAGGQMAGTGLAGLVNKPTYLIGEGKSAYPEFVIPTDPAYRDRASSLLNQAAYALGSKAATVSSVASRSSYVSPVSASKPSAAVGGGDTYISVDTFIGEEQWFAELSKQYNMTVVPRERKVAGQQRRVVSSYNNRWDIK